MNYRKLHRIFFTGVLNLTLAFSAVAESRLQLKAREVEMSGDYTSAIDLYKKDIAKQGKNAASLEGVARCYFALSNFEQAESFYHQLVDKDSTPKHFFAYAEALLRNAKYADAAKIARHAVADTSLRQHVANLVAACDSATKWEDTPAPSVMVHNLENVNTCYSDWGAQLYTPQKMLFISDRPMEQPNCDKGREQGASISDGFTALGAENDTVVLMEWSSVQMMPYPFSGKNVQIGPLALVPTDSSVIYYTQSSGKGKTTRTKVGKEVIRTFTENLEIYSAKQTPSGWEYLTPFEYNNPKEYSVMHPCLSKDGKMLYFVSDMPGGQGGLDIWMSEQQSGGRWGRPVNLGAPINTPANETFPTIGYDGTLYFSSNGHKGMGGLDIFATKKVKNKWQPVRNLKAPFNSSADDFFFVSLNDSIGYFSSNRVGGKGSDDIYMYTPSPLKSKKVVVVTPVDTTPAIDTTPIPAVDTTPIVPMVAEVEPVVELEPEPVIIPVVEVENETITLSGKLLDKQTKQPLSGVKICATQDVTKTSECKECSRDGSFNFTLKNNERYTVSAFKEGYQSSAPIRLLATTTMEEEEMPIELVPLAKAEFQSAEAVIDRTTAAAPKKKLLAREYRVQVLANWQETDWAYFDRLRHAYPQFELQYTKRDRAVRFTYGSFVNSQEARKYLRLFMNLGYEDSFIAVFEYGKQVESIFSGGSKEKVTPKRKPASRY